jgi:hypothetical protein
LILLFILFFLFLLLIKLKSLVQAQPKVTAASRRRWLGGVGVTDGGETPPLPFAATPLREGNGFAMAGIKLGQRVFWLRKDYCRRRRERKLNQDTAPL